ncbi:MAG: hypothetical protein ABI462_11375, partial [Ignavibacteria bacterium]
MLNSKVTDILKTFSDTELKLFEEYLKSPFLNKNNRIIKLFDCLKPYHPGYNNEDLSKDKLSRKLFGKKGSKETYLRNILSDLNIMAERFLSYLHYNSSNSTHTHLISELYLRGIGKHFNEKLDSFEKLIEGEKYKLANYYEDKLFLTEMKLQFDLDKKLIEKSKKAEIENKYNYFLLSIM